MPSPEKKMSLAFGRPAPFIRWSMMNRAAILNTTHFANKGSMGRIEGMIYCLDRIMPETEITIFHRYFQHGNDAIAKQLMEIHPNLVIKDHPWFNECNSSIMTVSNSIIRLGLIYCLHLFRLRSSSSTDLDNYDVVLDLNFIEPDKLTDKYDISSAVGNFLALLNVWYATLFKPPVMICSATIGPYHNEILRKFASIILNRADVITLRERYSQIYLTNIGVKKPYIELTADLAFLMASPKSDELNSILEQTGITSINRPLIGITPAAMFNSSLTESIYIKLISELSNFLISNYNATLIYIANTYQDISLAEKISQSIENSKRVRIIPFTLSASETKGIIGKCDIFICSRFHALVASGSLGIPSIGLVSYSPNKFHGIIGKIMDSEEYLLDIGPDFQYDNFISILKQKVDYLHLNHEIISHGLSERAEKVKEQVMINGFLIKRLITSLKGSSLKGE